MRQRKGIILGVPCESRKTHLGLIILINIAEVEQLLLRKLKECALVNTRLSKALVELTKLGVAYRKAFVSHKESIKSGISNVFLYVFH